MNIGDKGYKLLDCGAGRRLESFGGLLCDRPAPVATWSKALPAAVWRGADLYFDAAAKVWSGDVPEGWSVEFSGVNFLLDPASNGQVGVFPEQQENWRWIERLVASASKPVRVLNCFAHTGGSSIVASKGGAEVCHLDAARSANSRAELNAEYSRCTADSIRWVTEDALKFMAREARRGSKYDLIILDPPAFGRMKKKIWKFEKDMPELLKLTQEILAPEPLGFLLTSHNTGWKAVDQLDFVRLKAAKLLAGAVDTGGMQISGEGNSLPLGVFLRVEY